MEECWCGGLSAAGPAMPQHSLSVGPKAVRVHSVTLLYHFALDWNLMKPMSQGMACLVRQFRWTCVTVQPWPASVNPVSRKHLFQANTLIHDILFSGMEKMQYTRYFTG